MEKNHDYMQSEAFRKAQAQIDQQARQYQKAREVWGNNLRLEEFQVDIDEGPYLCATAIPVPEPAVISPHLEEVIPFPHTVMVMHEDYRTPQPVIEKLLNTNPLEQEIVILTVDPIELNNN